MEEINKFSTASLITRTSNDVTQVQMLVSMGLQVVIKAPIMAVWAIVKISGKSWQWSVATAAAVIAMVLMMLFILVIVFPKFKKVQKQTDNLNAVTRENLSGVRVVRAYNAEGYQEKKFEKANDDLTNTQLFTSRSMAIVSPFMTILMSGLSLAIYWIGAYLVGGVPDGPGRAEMFSQMAAYSGYAMMVVSAFMMLAMIFIILPRAMVSVRRINEVLSTEAQIKGGTVTQSPKEGGQGNVVFKNVSFKYPDASEYVLENVSFTAKQGETVAFIGSTGSGKSTFIQHLNGLIKLTSGKITVDGIELHNKPDLKKLRAEVGMVFQYPEYQIFDETVEKDVSFGPKNLGLKKDEIAERVKEAVETVGLDYEQFKERSPFELSGGQKRRVAIAGVIAMRPQILVLDEPTAGLDPVGRIEMFDLITKLKETTVKTIIMVSHNMDEISEVANKIAVLEHGKLRFHGTPKELFKHAEELEEIGLDIPTAIKLKNELKARGVELSDDIVTANDFVEAVVKWREKR